MPELPEVETVRQDLSKKILNKKIDQVVVYRPKSVGNKSAEFIKALTGNAITAIERRGKLMIFRLHQGDLSVLVHLKMTGQLIYEHELKNKKVEVVAGGHKLSAHDIENLPNQWTRIAFAFHGGGELFFNDQRLFGYMKLANDAAVARALKPYGPEPLSDDFTFAYFSEQFKKRQRAPLKAFLLNQEIVAGLGNIYVDEVCFCAHVRPNRRVGTITKSEQQKIFDCIPKILKEALRHRGTTFRNFLDASGKKGNYTDFLRVYDRDGEPCSVCGTTIKKTRVAGRGTHFCPKCEC